MAKQRKRLQNQSFSRPTLHDVARRAAVSASTVSRCLTVPEKVRPAGRSAGPLGGRWSFRQSLVENGEPIYVVVFCALLYYLSRLL